MLLSLHLLQPHKVTTSFKQSNTISKKKKQNGTYDNIALNQQFQALNE